MVPSWFNKILDLQRKLLKLFYGGRYELEDNIGHRNKVNCASTLEINSKQEAMLKRVKNQTKEVLKEYINEPVKLLEYMEERGTKIIILPYADKILRYIGEQEGLIMPLKGFKALFLTAALKYISKEDVEIGFETPEYFIVRHLEFNKYYLAHQFHHWMSYKMNLPGYEPKTIEKFKRIWFYERYPSEMTKLGIDDMLYLKDAIKRDVEAINFVKEFTRETIGQKDSFENIKNGVRVNL